MSHHVIEFDQKCKTCGGTGLYLLFRYNGAAAIACSICKGAGHHLTKIEYDDFDGLEEEKGVERVFEANLGMGENTLRLADYGGLPYRIWYNNYASQGQPFPLGTENRKYVCPAWWYQNVDYDRKPRWSECGNVVDFGTCDLFSEKDLCWKRWDWVMKKIAFVRDSGREFERAIDF